VESANKEVKIGARSRGQGFLDKKDVSELITKNTYRWTVFTAINSRNVTCFSYEKNYTFVFIDTNSTKRKLLEEQITRNRFKYTQLSCIRMLREIIKGLK